MVAQVLLAQQIIIQDLDIAYLILICTSGDSNTAIGFGSMGSAAVTGEGNVGMGMYALRYLTSGSGNVALGWDAAITLNVKEV